MTFRAGTIVNATEGIVPGTKVAAITDTLATANNAEQMLTGPGLTGAVETVVSSAQLVARSITYVLGTPANGAGVMPGNEVQSVFTNVAADPGQVKVCKIAGTPAPIGPSFTFSYSGLAYTSVDAGGHGVGPVITATGAITVPVGQCVLIGATSLNGFTPFLFNGNVTVTEAASTGNAVSGIATTEGFVSENVVGVPVLTTEPVLSGVNLTTGASAVTVSETAQTQLNYTDVDPPLVATGGSGGSTPVATGGSGAGSSSPSTGSSSPSTAPSSTPVIPTSVVSSTAGTITVPVSPIAVIAPVIATTTGSAVTPVITVKTLTAKQKAAELKAFSKTLAKVKAAIVNENKLITTAHGSARAADVRRLHALQLEQRLLNKEIRALK